MALQVEYTTEILYRFNGDEMDDDVYQETSGPGSIADIWKKFELIPTPPLSPSRQTTSSGASSPTCFTNSAADTLQNVSDILDVDNSRTTAYFTSLFGDSSGVNPNLIQDCMWGSHSTTDKKNLGHEEIYETPCSTPPSLLTLDYVSSECVDPTSVFPYHINQNTFPSDSSDEDEIDVVSVEKPVVLKRKTEAVKPETDANNNNDDDDSSCSSGEETEPSQKKSRTMTRRLRNNVNNVNNNNKSEPQVLSKEMSRRLSAKDNNSNHNTTRQEDPECKRTVHNVLERKRRNDLKYSFQVLRDSVPELTGSERAPKVAILKKATDCIESLKLQEQTLIKQKENLEKRNAQLVRKLKTLEDSQFSSNTPKV